MPEVDPQFETKFQNLIDHEYSGKDRATKEYPDGNFGITPGSTPPRWTPQQLFAELVREYKTMVDNNRARWENTFDQAVGLIQATVNTYGALLGEIAKRDLQNTTPEWDAWVEANAK